jgi:GNAT superfamily N-acetyltransferase
MLLDDAEVIARGQAGTLPARWRMRAESRGLRPLVQLGDEITVVQRRARVGDMVCVPQNGQLFWRRVLATRGDGALFLRREIAPFADGWHTGALGVLDDMGLLQMLARRWPRSWTTAGWWAARVVSRAVSLGQKVRAHRPRAPFYTRPLTLAELTGVASRADFDAQAERIVSGALIPIGLWTAAGELCGSTTLHVLGAEGFSSSTWVDPALRGRGGATLLVTAALEEARRRGCTRVTGHIAVSNYASLTAYRRAGLILTPRWAALERPFLATELQLRVVEWIAR